MRSEATPRIENDAFVGYVGASVDITERKRAEEALREADQRKDAFLAILAHELRNPLAPIRTGLELLRVGGDQPGAISRVRPILERQVAHMVRLIDDLLDVSRITSGKIQLQRQPTSLKELLNSAIDAHRAAIDAAGLTLSVDLPGTPCILEVDPTRFVQVLSNLLHNSTKFSPQRLSAPKRSEQQVRRVLLNDESVQDAEDPYVCVWFVLVEPIDFGRVCLQRPSRVLHHVQCRRDHVPIASWPTPESCMAPSTIHEIAQAPNEVVQ
jgi:signal transduction histidine kinase